MKNFSNKSLLKKNSSLRVANLIIILVIFLSSSFLIPNSNNITEIDREFNNLPQIPLLADIDSVLFEGSENALNITDYGNLYNNERQVEVNNQESVNLSYYLDDLHDWEASQINNLIYNIQDTRNWVNNSEFKSPTIFREYQISQTTHPYSQNHPISSIVDTITEVNNPTYMRAHFVNISFERYYDYFFILDENDQYQLITDTDYRSNVYSPWISGDTITVNVDNNLIFTGDNDTTHIIKVSGAGEVVFVIEDDKAVSFTSASANVNGTYILVDMDIVGPGYDYTPTLKFIRNPLPINGRVRLRLRLRQR